jgi:hypothetical protein
VSGGVAVCGSERVRCVVWMYTWIYNMRMRTPLSALVAEALMEGLLL